MGGRSRSIYFGNREGGADGFEVSARLAVAGPEAGFNQSEWRILSEAGAEPKSLGMPNLRIETAVVAAVVAFHVANGQASKV